ncbi:putative cytosol aminopeptidase [Synergistales bacterium]|nr:putative cytosol aminopeptidase [Synergistales bacterium]
MIKIAISTDEAKIWKGDALLFLLTEETCKDYNDSRIKTLVERGDFKGKAGSVTRVPLFDSPAKNLYLAGLGKNEKQNVNLPGVLTSALRKIGKERNQSVFIILNNDGFSKEESVILGEAAGLCGYSFDKYKKKEDGDGDGDDAFALKEIFVRSFDADVAQKGAAFASGQCIARDLANEPGNVINPPILAEIAEGFARERNITCEVWDEKRLAEEKMGALLAVGQGSETPPRLIHLTYKPKGAPRKKVVFVGKGLTFDSGGLDLKSGEFMKTMKGDKSGACNVLGILDGASALGLGLEIHGILAAAENMPSGHALRPDDIIRARNGKTIEIDNTDAEGRLVLADALCLASELKPDAIIDTATLTGACAVALGSWTAGLFASDDKLAESLLSSSRKRGERLWRLPMDDEKIGESLKSKFADLINSGSRYGGATFAAMFLAEFVEKGIPWAHLDIAGVDFMKDDSGVWARGASAFGVRLCLDYLTDL